MSDEIDTSVLLETIRNMVIIKLIQSNNQIAWMDPTKFSITTAFEPAAEGQESKLTVSHRTTIFHDKVLAGMNYMNDAIINGAVGLILGKIEGSISAEQLRYNKSPDELVHSVSDVLTVELHNVTPREVAKAVNAIIQHEHLELQEIATGAELG